MSHPPIDVPRMVLAGMEQAFLAAFCHGMRRLPDSCGAFEAYRLPGNSETQVTRHEQLIVRSDLNPWHLTMAAWDEVMQDRLISGAGQMPRLGGVIIRDPPKIECFGLRQIWRLQMRFSYVPVDAMLGYEAEPA
jgi:hypothetical protein